MAARRNRRVGSDLGDLRVLAVTSEGEVLLGLPGGGVVTVQMPKELVHFYRRLIPDLGDDPVPADS